MHGNGVGVPSPDAVEKRAREIAMIDERDPNEFTDADWNQARKELMGVEHTSAPEETESDRRMERGPKLNRTSRAASRR